MRREHAPSRGTSVRPVADNDFIFPLPREKESISPTTSSSTRHWRRSSSALLAFGCTLAKSCNAIMTLARAIAHARIYACTIQCIAFKTSLKILHSHSNDMHSFRISRSFLVQVSFSPCRSSCYYVFRISVGFYASTQLRYPCDKSDYNCVRASIANPFKRYYTIFMIGMDIFLAQLIQIPLDR